MKKSLDTHLGNAMVVQRVWPEILKLIKFCCILLDWLVKFSTYIIVKALKERLSKVERKIDDPVAY